MLTEMEDWYTPADIEVIELLENRFKKAVQFFRPLTAPDEDPLPLYWHVRMKGEKEHCFLRKDPFGGIHLYGPTTGQLMYAEDF